VDRGGRGTGHHGWRHAILLLRRLPASTASAWRQLGVPSCTSAFGCPWYQASITRGGPRLSFRARQLSLIEERRNEARRLTSSLPTDIPYMRARYTRTRLREFWNLHMYVRDIIIDKSPIFLATNCANYYLSSRIYVEYLRSCVDGGRFVETRWFIETAPDRDVRRNVVREYVHLLFSRGERKRRAWGRKKGARACDLLAESLKIKPVLPRGRESHSLSTVYDRNEERACVRVWSQERQEVFESDRLGPTDGLLRSRDSLRETVKRERKPSISIQLSIIVDEEIKNVYK